VEGPSDPSCADTDTDVNAAAAAAAVVDIFLAVELLNKKQRASKFVSV